MRISDWSSDVCSSDLYDHTDLGAVFDSVRKLLMRLLNEITLGPEMFVRFERDGAADTLYRADLPGNFFGPRHRYYLMARSTAEPARSAEHTSELQSLMRTSYAVSCLKKKKTAQPPRNTTHERNK